MPNDALRALQEAKKASQARAAKEAEAAPRAAAPDLDHAEALVQLCVYMYSAGCTFGLGALPDGSGIYGRLRVPGKSEDPHAGMVAFVVSDDPLSVLLKALAAMESPPTSNFWKPDRFANS